MGLGFKLNRWGLPSVFFGLALSLCVLLSFSTPVLAQSATGTVTGQITDQQQAAIGVLEEDALVVACEQVVQAQPLELLA